MKSNVRYNAKLPCIYINIKKIKIQFISYPQKMDRLTYRFRFILKLCISVNIILTL